ncbi:hypothetical protein J6590_027793 [Homalodisca vitripennis]|nr:hypothetical protein J6590_027793 [Homalodisca vitripennis]
MHISSQEKSKHETEGHRLTFNFRTNSNIRAGDLLCKDRLTQQSHMTLWPCGKLDPMETTEEYGIYRNLTKYRIE